MPVKVIAPALALAALLALTVACGGDEPAEDSSPDPRPTAAPSLQPTAAPAPAKSGVSAPKPSGHLLIAVAGVGSPNGLPRFCTAGCSENIYLSGITEVLFNSRADANGMISTEPMLALDFTLDPSLEFGDITLRQGVMFHGDWGEMTAEDVAFTYNDANSVTNPESTHGQAGDFAPLIRSIVALEPYRVRLNYRSYDSRGMLHRFSRFWQTAGIVSKSVFDATGVDGMNDMYVGVGAFVADRWTPEDGILLSANPNYYGTALGLGPFVDSIHWLAIPDAASRRATLEAGKAHIAAVSAKDFRKLTESGLELQKKGLFNTIQGISFTGNYWERFSALTGEELTRDRETGMPWVGDPFETGPDYDEGTPSMMRSRKVRNALAWAIEREELVENLLGETGFVNHQPYLSSNNSQYREEWSWGTDFEMARSLLTEAGYDGGFSMSLWVGADETGAEIGEAIKETWAEELGVVVKLISSPYSTYRPGLVSRTISIPGISICGDENKSNFPYDWAHGFAVSSFSAGGYGVGQEVPYAAEAYAAMAGEPDKASREELAARFYSENRKWANCVGLFEEPVWPAYNPDLIAEWDMRPTANQNLGTINNVRTIKLR